MNRTKQIFVTSFASFSMFFGAGNLILPPLLGFRAGQDWWLVAIGFFISAVFIPLLGVFAHAKLQGTVLDFTKRLPAGVGLLYCFSIYAVCLFLPAPRTASVTYELAIAPFFNMSSLWFSSLYFLLAMVLVFNRSKILDILGQYLTPIIIGAIILIVGIGLFLPHPSMLPMQLEEPLVAGLFEGYQTFDAIAGIVVGGVIVVSLSMDKSLDYYQRRSIVKRSGIITGIALFSIYAGFIYTGALFNSEFPLTVTRVELLAGMSLKTLGNVGAWVLSVLVSLACFTTAVGIIAGAADFIKSQTKNSVRAYKLTVVGSCILGVLIGRLDVYYIIAIAVPVLMLIYPITIMFIILNVVPENIVTKKIFISVISITFLFSLPDFFIATKLLAKEDIISIPLGDYHLGWLFPMILVWGGTLMYERLSRRKIIKNSLR